MFTATDITQQRQTENKLKEAGVFICSLYTVAADTHLDFDTLLQRILSIGRMGFKTDIGILVHIAGETYEVVASQLPQGFPFPIKVGDRNHLKQTYCRETIQEKEPISFENAGNSEW